MTTLREAAQQALEALIAVTTRTCAGTDGMDITPINDAFDMADTAIAALRSALAQQEQTMSKKTVWYRCLTHCEESFYVFRTMHGDFDRWMAQEAARDYHNGHDGWKDNWPLEFSLHETEGGPELARFEVHREAEPVFYATAIAKAEGA